MSKSKKGQDSTFIAENRKAYFNYEVLETLECGMVLVGSEVKSVRSKLVNFVDSFVEIQNGELFLLKFHITPYAFSNINNHDIDRPRKLLAHKQEIIKLWNQVRIKGYTLIPLRLYYKTQRIKVQIGLCRGKKKYDKKEAIKQRDIQKQNERDISSWKLS